MLTVSFALWLRLYHSLPPRVIESLARDGWKLLRKARIPFRWERRPFPLAQRMSFRFFSVAPHLRSSFDTDRRETRRITSTLCAFHSIWKRVAPYFSSARNGSNVFNVLCHAGECFNSQRTQQFNNAWKNYHLETLAG